MGRCPRPRQAALPTGSRRVSIADSCAMSWKPERCSPHRVAPSEVHETVAWRGVLYMSESSPKRSPGTHCFTSFDGASGVSFRCTSKLPAPTT